MSDEDVRRAMSVIKRHGAAPVAEMLQMFPVLRHEPGTLNRRGFDIEDFKLRHEIETRDEWARWMREIPEIEFPAGWKIRMRPPMTGAIVRFDANGISVYLDCYERLGLGGGPYWEIHPSENGDCERFAMEDIEGLLDGLERARVASVEA
jgi:hypothetical protein